MFAASTEQIAVIASWLLGWFYFCAWTFSFFPQPFLNWQRRTTQGLTPDFPLLNVFGFSCYTLSTSLFLFSATIREQYAIRHPKSPQPTVRENDLVFGIVALIMSVITYSQFWPKLWHWRPKPEVQLHANPITLGLIAGSFVALGITVAMTASHGSVGYRLSLDWIDAVYALEYVKLLMTLFKYVPQAVANFRRKSTSGWSITQQLLDFSGGIGSLLQLIIDSSRQGDWSGLTGNPLKLGLANISLGFDVIFILQHFVLFGPVDDNEENSHSQPERAPLLSRVESE